MLGLVFIGELLGAGQPRLDAGGRTCSRSPARLASCSPAIAAVNVVQGRPARAIPKRIGKTELAAFVILPALLPLIFGGQLGSAATTVAANLLLLALIYAVFVFGLLAILRWVFGRLAGQLRSSLGLLAKAVPLLAIFALLSFASQEMWQIFGTLSDFAYVCTIGLFVAPRQRPSSPSRVPVETRRLEREASADGPPLSRAQRVNVGLVLFVSQALQVLFVSLFIGAFFVLFGMLAIDDAARESLARRPAGNVLVTVSIGGDQFELTEELLRVAGGLAAFSGFYFAVAMLTDSTYREEFLEELTEEMGASFRARAAYLRLRAAGSLPA